MNIKKSETPRQKKERPMRKKEPFRQKKETRSLSAMTSRVTTPKSFLLLVESTMGPSLDDALANHFTCSSCLFYQRPKTKNTK